MGRVLRYVIFLKGAGCVISQDQATASAVRHPTIPAPPGTQEHESQVYVNLPIEHFNATLFSLLELQDANTHPLNELQLQSCCLSGPGDWVSVHASIRVINIC